MRGGESNELALKMRWQYGEALYKADGATLDDLREAVAMVAETAPIARRVFGAAHPVTTVIEHFLQKARDALGARENAATVDPD